MLRTSWEPERESAPAQEIRDRLMRALSPPGSVDAPPPFTDAPPPFTDAPPPFTDAPPPFTDAPPPFTDAPAGSDARRSPVSSGRGPAAAPGTPGAHASGAPVPVDGPVPARTPEEAIPVLPGGADAGFADDGAWRGDPLDGFPRGDPLDGFPRATRSAAPCAAACSARSTRAGEAYGPCSSRR